MVWGTGCHRREGEGATGRRTGLADRHPPGTSRQQAVAVSATPAVPHAGCAKDAAARQSGGSDFAEVGRRGGVGGFAETGVAAA